MANEDLGSRIPLRITRLLRSLSFYLAVTRSVLIPRTSQSRPTNLHHFMFIAALLSSFEAPLLGHPAQPLSPQQLAADLRRHFPCVSVHAPLPVAAAAGASKSTGPAIDVERAADVEDSR